MESVKDIKMLLLWELELVKSYYGLTIRFCIFNKFQVSTTPENDEKKNRNGTGNGNTESTHADEYLISFNNEL